MVGSMILTKSSDCKGFSSDLELWCVYPCQPVDLSIRLFIETHSVRDMI